MKQEVKAAAVRVQSGSIQGWVRVNDGVYNSVFERSPQTARLKILVPTSFQAEVLVQYGIPLTNPGCN